MFRVCIGESKMAGCSKLKGFKSFRMIESSYELLRSEETKLKGSFAELILAFVEENCSRECFRPVPPMLGNGCCIDLLKLYFVVKLKGGFDSISRKKLWNEVGVLYGLGPGFGSALKLIYLKYLDSLESWLVKLPSSGSSKSERFNTGVWSKGVLMALGSEYSCFVSNIVGEMRKSEEGFGSKEEKSGISFIDSIGQENENENENEKAEWEKFVMSFGDEEDTIEENEDTGKVKEEVPEISFADGLGFSGKNYDEENFKHMKSEASYVGVLSSDASDDGKSSVGPVVADNVVKSSENSFESKKCSNEDEDLAMCSSAMKEVSSLKRKRDSLTGMLDWMTKVAKDPIDPEIGTIPESYSWGVYGNDRFWKQVLLAREALFSKMNADQSIFQKKQKMHPSMFDDYPECSERPRSSPRLYIGKPGNSSSFNLSNIGRPRQRLEARLDMQPKAPIYTSRPYQRIPIGIDFQAEVPKWTGVVAESDPKWLGTRVWPLETKEDDGMIKRDSIGKGRVDPCGCLFPGTNDCLKFHVSRRRMNLKYELASAFYVWMFDKMGEECSVPWTSEEEKTFKAVVKKNPFSQQKCFWKQMCEALPKKTWVDQVNYYFNVFVLQRRAFQNKFTPRNVDSDDDETEYGPVTNALRRRTESCASISSSKMVQ